MKYVAVILLLSATFIGGCVIIDASDYRDLKRGAAETQMNARATPASARIGATDLLASAANLPPSSAE